MSGYFGISNAPMSAANSSFWDALYIFWLCFSSFPHIIILFKLFLLQCPNKWWENSCPEIKTRINGIISLISFSTFTGKIPLGSISKSNASQPSHVLNPILIAFFIIWLGILYFNGSNKANNIK